MLLKHTPVLAKSTAIQMDQTTTAHLSIVPCSNFWRFSKIETFHMSNCSWNWDWNPAARPSRPLSNINSGVNQEEGHVRGHSSSGQKERQWASNGSRRSSYTSKQIFTMPKHLNKSLKAFFIFTHFSYFHKNPQKSVAERTEAECQTRLSKTQITDF